MWKKNILARVCVLVSLSFMSAYAHAVSHTVRIDDLVYTPYGSIAHTSTAPVSSGNFYAGEMKGLLDGNSFLAYCVEISQGLIPGFTYTDYGVVSGVAVWGASKSLALDHLVSYVVATGYGGNTAQSAVVQAAFWEIIEETLSAPLYAFSTGTFKEFSYVPSIQTELNAFNWNTALATPITMHVDQLHSPSAQDFAIVHQVPELHMWTLFASGLLSLPWLLSRRKKGRSPSRR